MPKATRNLITAGADLADAERRCVFPRVGAREATGSAAEEPMQQNDGVEMKRVMRHVVYVAERDGDYAAWRAGWNSQGYDLMPLNINEPALKTAASGGPSSCKARSRRLDAHSCSRDPRELLAR